MKMQENHSEPTNLPPLYKGWRIVYWVLAVAFLLTVLGFGGWLLYQTVEPESSSERNEALRTVAQVFTGIGVFVGITVGALNWRTTKQALEHTRFNNERAHGLDVLREWNTRFHSATQLLGSGNEDARIGAVYAIEQLSKETKSMESYWVCVELLCSFIRRRSRELGWMCDDVDVEAFPKTGEDIAVAMTVLARRRFRYGEGEHKPLDLHEANLNSCLIEEGSFQEVNLDRSALVHTEFRNCNMVGANIQHADARFAQFKNSALMYTRFQYADLYGAHIQVSDKVSDPRPFVTHHHTAYFNDFTHYPFGGEIESSEDGRVNGQVYLRHTNVAVSNLYHFWLDSHDPSGIYGMTEAQWNQGRRYSAAVPPKFIDIGTQHPKTPTQT